MEIKKANSYAYFALKGDDFVPEMVTRKLKIAPTNSWRKGDKGTYNSKMEFACCELATEKGKENIWIDLLVKEVVDKLFEKIPLINELKHKLELTSVLQIVLEIDMNEEVPEPALGHNLKTIEFLYKTQTVTDVDIYRVQ